MDTFLIGEQLAIDLVNTRTRTDDLIATPGLLGDWIAREGSRLPDIGAGPGPSMHRTVLEVREWADVVIRAVSSGRRPPSSALRRIERLLDAAPVTTRLGWDGSAVTTSTQRSGSDEAVMAASLADAVVALLAMPELSRLKECEADDCRMLFLPAHPRRRWCSSRRCGNRVRVARHYVNRKRSETAGE